MLHPCQLDLDTASCILVRLLDDAPPTLSLDRQATNIKEKTAAAKVFTAKRTLLAAKTVEYAEQRVAVAKQIVRAWTTSARRLPSSARSATVTYVA